MFDEVVAYRRMWFRSHVDHEGQRAPTKMDWADSHRCPTGSLNERDAYACVCVVSKKQARFDLGPCDGHSNDGRLRWPIFSKGREPATAATLIKPRS